MLGLYIRAMKAIERKVCRRRTRAKREAANAATRRTSEAAAGKLRPRARALVCWLAAQASALHMQRELTPAEEEDEVAGSSWRQPLARAAASCAPRVRAEVI